MTSPARQIVVLADDLIWATRLAAQVRALGLEAVLARDLETFRAALGSADGAIVDLTARGYDGVAAIAAAARTGRRVIAAAQHDDAPLRKAAMAAGAERVFAYRKLFEDGPATIGRWLGSPIRVGPGPEVATE